MKLNKRIIASSLGCVLSIASIAQEGIMKTEPYLQNPTNKGITVSWLTNKKVHSWVEYGTHPDSLNKKAERLIDGQSFCYNTIHHVRLKELDPDKIYYYRVGSREITQYEAYKKVFGETAYSNVYAYKPVDEKSESFNAIVFNDLHKNESTLDRLSEHIDLEKVNMIFFNGDCIDDPKDEDSVLKFMNYAHKRLNASSIPVVYIRGNHEIRNAYSIQLRDLIDYIGGNTSYGAFTFGNTRFVMLDCGEDKPDNHWVYYNLNSFEQFRKDQAVFLRNEIKSKEHKKAEHRVLLHHIPIYGFRDDYLPCRELWSATLSKSKFDIALNAHTHEYKFVDTNEDSNVFPVIIGGGPKKGSATVIYLKKDKKQFNVSVISDSGDNLLELDL